MEKFVETIQSTLEEMELCFGNGEPVRIAMSAGRPIRLLSKTGEQAVSALAQAQDSVEAVCREMEKSPLGACMSRLSA